MRLENIHNVFFVGIGGIGMSAIARWFSMQGKTVSGYDRTSSPLTLSLQNEGIEIHYTDDLNLVSEVVKTDKLHTLVVYTPAIPSHHSELQFFMEHGFTVMKRSEVLGVITKDQFTVGVAGTHGKTTTSSMVAHLLNHSGFGCNAFIGGIMTNYNSNLILGKKEDVVVVEADEFDRSFLRLFPNISIVTSVDPDHLDIYGDGKEMIKTFNEYAAKTDKEGNVIIHESIKDNFDEKSLPGLMTYSKENGDVKVTELKIRDGVFEFNYHGMAQVISGLELSVPGFHNMENCIAAITVALKLGISQSAIKAAVKSYKGVKRRFEYIVKNNNLVFIDDYAHHPGEIKALISSIRALYPNKKLTAIFQPHLYSRTNDFAEGFAEELSKVDELVLLDIYPAREEPLPGVTSKIISKKVTQGNQVLIEKKDLLSTIENMDIELLVTIGAGDIDREIPKLVAHFNKKEVGHA